jgi:nucleoside-diphosphate-sugar epimerase
MKIAITGATGFIGFHVRKKLALTDNEVVLGVRNLKRVGELAINETPVEFEMSEEGLNWFEILGKPDAVLHLAWGGLPNYMDKFHLDVELPMQLRFLKSLLNNGLDKLVVTGTCYEYGAVTGAISENQNTNPITSYGVAKDLLRKELVALQVKQNFKLTWARIFYPFGEGQSENALLSQLKSAVLAGHDEFEVKSGDSILDFINVQKVAEILLKLVEHTDGVGVVNVGSGVSKSLESFVKDQILINAWDIDLKISSRNDREYEPKSFWACTDKLTKVLR